MAEKGWWREGFLGEGLWRGSLRLTIAKGVESHTRVRALSLRGGKPGVVLSTRGTQSKPCLLGSSILASLPRHVSR